MISMITEMTKGLAKVLMPLSRASRRPSLTKKTEIRNDRTDEWPRLAKGGSSSNTTLALADLWRPVATYAPTSAGDANLHAAALDLVETVTLQRRFRLLAASRTIPALVWVILGFGGIVTVLLSTFSAPPPRLLRHTFVAALAVMIALSLYTLYVLNHPFGAGLPLISPERLQSVQELLATPP